MSREEVIRQIVKRDVNKLDLTEETVSNDDAALYKSGCEQFGTWETALKYAGVTVRGSYPRNQYTANAVLKEIRYRCTSQYSLSATHILRHNRRLYDAARQHFGTWRKAMRAAGINLKGLKDTYKNCSKQELIQALHERKESGLPLAWTHVCLENRGFALKVKHTFGSWRNALIAAGIPVVHLHEFDKEPWNKERIIKGIHELHRKGKSLQCARVREKDPSLVNAANRYFGGWENAVKASALEIKKDEGEAERLAKK